ncbi:MAG: FHA domain-containing protein, partial [Gracilibacteraceae bacterium]|nr:FHA domain-containing protein [Gracilibacteraceae bacterium]
MPDLLICLYADQTLNRFALESGGGAVHVDARGCPGLGDVRLTFSESGGAWAVQSNRPLTSGGGGDAAQSALAPGQAYQIPGGAFFAVYGRKGDSPAMRLDGKSAVSVGRGAHCQIRLNNRQVSNVHCEIRKGDGGRYFLTDQRSANGTYLNGAR